MLISKTATTKSEAPRRNLVAPDKGSVCMVHNDRPTGSVGCHCGWLRAGIDGDDAREKVEEVTVRQGTYVVRQVMLSWSDVDN
jgi:hypothetical protein